MDRELKGIMFEKQKKIIREVIEYTMKHYSPSLVSNVPIPDFMFVNVAMGQGNCFFDAVTSSIKQIRPNHHFNVKSLRGVCKSFAQKELKKDKSWLIKALNKEGEEIEQYIPRIEFDANDITHKQEELEILGLTTSIGGRPDIEDGNCMNYNEDDMIYIVNDGSLHFEPILDKRKSSNPEQVDSRQLDEIIEEIVKEFLNQGISLNDANIRQGANVEMEIKS
ncbi:uncharacterized protein LOC116431988 [Nomia melanderi]|uniref:uncharacterized protein LOC116431988 n=1 Tax=Nomia melanderi TaxID=2448451 RepID=UPI0013045F6F|nr:uncharacterized protein LOC116431988 [Nomia melanderi]